MKALTCVALGLGLLSACSGGSDGDSDDPDDNTDDGEVADAGAGAQPEDDRDPAAPDADVQPRVHPGPCSIVVDDGHDGTIDHTFAITYSPAGLRLREERDYDNNGLLSVTTWTYNGPQLILEVQDRDNDGTWNSQTVYHRDTAGMLQRLNTTVLVGKNDSTTLHFVRTYTYSATGTLTVETQDNGFEWRYHYGPSGLLDRKDRLRYGQPSGAQVYVYDVEGRMVRETATDVGSEYPTLDRTYAYDTDGNIVQHVDTGWYGQHTATYDYSCFTAQPP